MDEHERAERTPQEWERAESEFERLAEEGADAERFGALEFTRAPASQLPEGQFHMTMATQGEASDDHILSVKGFVPPPTGRMSMLLAHVSTDKIPALGHVTEFRKGREAIPRLRGLGKFNLNPDPRDTVILPRRVGVWNLVENRDIEGTSVRWNAIKSTPRVDLPSSHPAHVKAGSERRFGRFFERWLGREQSIVAVGADLEALTYRARALGPEVERLVRSMDLPGRAEPDAVRDGLVAAVDAARATGLDEAGVSALLAGIIGTEAQVPLVRYLYLDGAELRECWLPEVARDALQGESREALSEVLDAVRAMGERMTPPTPPASREAAPAKPRPAPTPAPVISPKPRTIGDLTERELFEGLAKISVAAVRQVLEPLAAGRVRR